MRGSGRVLKPILRMTDGERTGHNHHDERRRFPAQNAVFALFAITAILAILALCSPSMRNREASTRPSRVRTMLAAQPIPVTKD